ncbi:MAG: tetratricopeptide repeat protein, partial [Phycisphaeraceae bacterium]|nr:tetratricopeptide repeat protein [Phycisphaeraceae bacterium]
MQHESLGPDHLDIATTHNDMADMYREMDRYDAAEPLYKRALEMRQKSLKKNDPLIVAILISLADLYSAANMPQQLAATKKR